MTTHIPAHGETETIAIAAPSSTVLAIIADPLRLPDWAPAFATAVTPADDGLWHIDQGAGTTFLIDVAVHSTAGTVDLLRPNDPSRGARLRALTSGTGTELLFTILFPPEAPQTAIDAQMATVRDELRTIRTLAEAAIAAG
jgi:hypothetical protein